MTDGAELNWRADVLKFEPQPFAAPRGFYVYALIDPRRDLPFYIGKGVRRRALQHAANWRAGREQNQAKAEAFDEIHEAQLEPSVLILRDGMTSLDAYALERALIDRYRLILTNGPNGRVTSKIWAKRALRRFKTMDEWLGGREPNPYELDLYTRIRVEFETIAQEGIIAGVRMTAQGVIVDRA